MNTTATNKDYNLFGELRANIEDFDTKGHYIVGKPSASDEFDKTTRGRGGGYYYSQRETLDAVDLATASKFKEGPVDSEGKRKTYMNIVNFHKDVALNQIGVNVANYIMEPTDDQYAWPTLFMDKRFKEWADENSYDDQIDEQADDYVGRGSVVSKRVRGQVHRIPLRTLRNTQTARSLEEAARNGGYVIIEDEMHYSTMKKFPGWKVDDLDKKKSYQYFEQYSLIPRAELMKFKGETPTDADYDDMICCMQILIPDEVNWKSKEPNKKGVVAFIEEIIDGAWPLDEAHYRRIDGRWLGEGEVEKQLENQVAKNLGANLRRRSLLWHARKIFQSTDDEVKRNLLMSVKDGEVLKIKTNGQVSQVNVASQGTADFNADSAEWDKNSQQKSFTFESASGESMPSGTPFRLGVLLEGAVSKYFKRKQDTFSNFLKRSFFDQIIPIFIEENSDEHSLAYTINDSNYDQVREALIVLKANERVHDAWSNSQWLTYEEARIQVEDELNRHPYLFIKMAQNSYKDPHCVMRLNINEPIAADVETLTTLYTSMQQSGDPRAEKVLRAILSKKGKNLDAIAGPMPKPAAAPVAPGGAPSNPVDAAVPPAAVPPAAAPAAVPNAQ